jgi:hypothetical protein
LLSVARFLGRGDPAVASKHVSLTELYRTEVMSNYAIRVVDITYEKRLKARIAHDTTLN